MFNFCIIKAIFPIGTNLVSKSYLSTGITGLRKKIMSRSLKKRKRVINSNSLFLLRFCELLSTEEEIKLHVLPHPQV